MILHSKCVKLDKPESFDIEGLCAFCVKGVYGAVSVLNDRGGQAGTEGEKGECWGLGVAQW